MGREKDSFSLGELLKVQVKLANESVYGIFVRNIIASNGQKDAVTLIDRYGCPSEGKLMKEVRLLDETSKSLESSFEAFSFTGSNYLTLQAEVETCLDVCKPVHCSFFGRSDDEESDSGGHVNGTVSYGRRRRSTNLKMPIDQSSGPSQLLSSGNLNDGKENNQLNNDNSNGYVLEEFQVTHPAYNHRNGNNRQKRSQQQPHHKSGDVLAIQKVAKQIRLITNGQQPLKPTATTTRMKHLDEESSEIESLDSNDVQDTSRYSTKFSSKKHHLKQPKATLGNFTWIIFGIGLVALFVLQITCGLVVCSIGSSSKVKGKGKGRLSNQEDTSSSRSSRSAWRSDVSSFTGTISDRSVLSASSAFSSIASSYRESEQFDSLNVENDVSRGNKCHRSNGREGKSNLFNSVGDETVRYSYFKHGKLKDPEKYLQRLQLKHVISPHQPTKDGQGQL